MWNGFATSKNYVLVLVAIIIIVVVNKNFSNNAFSFLVFRPIFFWFKKKLAISSQFELSYQPWKLTELGENTEFTINHLKLICIVRLCKS